MNAFVTTARAAASSGAAAVSAAKREVRACGLGPATAGMAASDVGVGDEAEMCTGVK